MTATFEPAAGADSGGGTPVESTVDGRGPTAAALSRLRDWLAAAVGPRVPVVVEAPRDGEHSRICVWPLALLPDQGTRGGGRREPLRLRMRYLIAADGPVERAADLIDLVLAAGAADDGYHLVFEPVPSHLWGTGGRLPAPSLLLDVPVQIRPAIPAVPRVRGELRLTGGPMRTVRGRVLGPGGVPLSEITLTAPATGSATRTDARGEFVLPGLPAGHPVLLHLAGRGLRMQAQVDSAQVDSGATEQVVIHCDIEEV